MVRLSILLVVGVLALVGCGDDADSDSASTTEPTTTTIDTFTPPAKPPKQTVTPSPSKSKPTEESNPSPPPGGAPQSAAYSESRDLCSLFGPSQVAKEYGGGSNPVEIAHAYAEASYQPQFQQDALEGCLAGFK